MRSTVYGLWSTVFLMFIAYGLQLTAAYGEPDRTGIARIEKLFLRGDYDKVIYEADRSIDSRASQRDELYYLKGLSQLKLERFNDARDSFRKVAVKYPRSKRAFDSYMGIGDSYFLEGDMNNALKGYQDLLSRYPDNKNISLAYYRMGACFEGLGSSDRADEYFAKAMRISPLSFESKMDAQISPSKRIQAPKPPRDRYFSVQVGSFKNKKNAQRLNSKLRKMGFDSFIDLPAGSGDELYRVKVARLASREKAEVLAAKLKRLKLNTKICNVSIRE